MGHYDSCYESAHQDHLNNLKKNPGYIKKERAKKLIKSRLSKILGIDFSDHENMVALKELIKDGY